MTIDLWGIALMHCIYGHFRAAFVLPTDAASSERDRARCRWNRCCGSSLRVSPWQ